MKFKKKSVFLSVTLILLSFFLYSFFIEPNSIKTTELDVESDCIEGQGDNRIFAQISDLHFTENTEDTKIADLFNSINGQNPSLVFITGDLIASKGGIEKAVSLVRLISSEYPTFIVFGNWDYWSLDFDMKFFTSRLENAGAKVVTNKNEMKEFGGKTFYILGVKDPYTSGENEEDIKRALSGIDPIKKSCKILLAHSPNVIKYAMKKDIDLILVGHTHGGQIYIPYLSEYFIPARREAGKGYVSGLYKIGDDKMYVNRGIGMSVLPLRFLVPPELTIITIK